MVKDYQENYADFNSHAHVERDRCVNAIEDIRYISTHTLTWSVTNSAKHDDLNNPFQLTRSRGA